METLLEELRLLSLLEEGGEDDTMEICRLAKAVRGLLNLYHDTAKEKNDMQDSLSLRCSEIKTLQALEERLKWQRVVELEKAALQKTQKEVSSLKDELRKIICSASLKTKKNGELLFEGGHMRILNNHLATDTSIHDKVTTSKEIILRKGMKRLDMSQRVLVQESASICSSLRLINSSVQQAIIAMKVHIGQDDRTEECDGMQFQDKLECDPPTWLPLLLHNTHQKCAELNKMVDILQKISSLQKVDIAEEAVSKFMQSFSNFEKALDEAAKSMSIK